MLLTQVIIKPNLRLVRYTADFIKILEVSEFPIGCIAVGRNVPTTIQTYGKLTKPTVDPKNLKFGMMITWVNKIVQNNCCHSNKP